MGDMTTSAAERNRVATNMIPGGAFVNALRGMVRPSQRQQQRPPSPTEQRRRQEDLMRIRRNRARMQAQVTAQNSGRGSLSENELAIILREQGL